MPEMERVGVVGAGTMGNGVAHVCARAGLSVVLYDVQRRFLDRGLATIEKNLAREVAKGRQEGRTVEIQRLIGRSLRAVVNLQKLGQNTLWVDCDVLQADGGTRTASITGGWVALYDCLRWMETRQMAKIDKVLQGTGPAKSVNYRFQLTWASEDLRQKWVASADHVANWPLLEKTLTDKNYTVILTHAV